MEYATGSNGFDGSGKQDDGDAAVTYTDEQLGVKVHMHFPCESVPGAAESVLRMLREAFLDDAADSL